MNAWQRFVLENGQVISIQVTVVFCVAVAVDQLARRAAAAWRHAIWASAVSTCLVILFAGNLLPNLRLIPFDWLLFQEASVSTTTSHHVRNDTSSIPLITAGGQPRLIRPHADTHRSETAAPPVITTWLCRIWLVGVCIGVARLLVSFGRMQWLIRSGRETENQHLADLAVTTARQLGLKKTPQLKVNSKLCVPLAYGIFRPVVVIGSDVESMTETDQYHVLLHEQGHLKRSDPLWQWVLGLAQSVFWFHPLMWNASYCMTTLREYACDDLVISQTDAPQSYASLLVAIAGRVRRTTSTAIAVTMTSARPTEQRIRRLFKSGIRQTIPSTSAMGVSIAAVVTIGLVVSLLRTTNAASPADEPDTLSPQQSVPAAATQAVDTDDKASKQPANVDVTFIFGKHAIIHVDGDSRRVVSDDEVFQIIKEKAQDAIVRPVFVITRAGIPREQSLKPRKMKLYGELYEKGRSNGMRMRSLSPRSWEYWDSVCTNEDLIVRAVDLNQGQVITPDGTPAGNAQVLVLPEEHINAVNLTEGRVRESLEENLVNTDAAGSFRIDSRGEYWIAALHQKGFVIKPIEEWNSKRRLQLQAWAEVRGNVFGDGQAPPAEGPQISDFPLSIHSYPVRGMGFTIFSTQVEADGSFHQKFVPPGNVNIGRSYAADQGTSFVTPGFELTMKPGENQLLSFTSGTPQQLLESLKRLKMRLQKQ